MPIDLEQAQRQRAEQQASERQSQGRAKAATGSPLKSSGGGGFQAAPAAPKIKPSADPTFDKTPPIRASDYPTAKPRTTKTSFGPGDV